MIVTALSPKALDSHQAAAQGCSVHFLGCSTSPSGLILVFREVLGEAAVHRDVTHQMLPMGTAQTGTLVIRITISRSRESGMQIRVRCNGG